MTLFKSLDFLYIRAPDIDSSVKYYTEILGAELRWKIHAFGVWVACVRLADIERPYLLLADHIRVNDVIQIFQVESIDRTSTQLRSKGWHEEKMVEIPPGPCATFRDPAGNSLAIYENKRPFIMKEFEGRIETGKNGDSAQIPGTP